jgi:hypothetical protein
MKTSELLMSAAIACGFFAASTLAYADKPTPGTQSPRTAAPTVVKAVGPVYTRPAYEGRTILVSLTIDVTGQPHQIKITNIDDPGLAQALIPILEQWRFTPMQRNGVAVSTRALLPLHIIAGA